MCACVRVCVRVCVCVCVCEVPFPLIHIMLNVRAASWQEVGIKS